MKSIKEQIEETAREYATHGAETLIGYPRCAPTTKADFRHGAEYGYRLAVEMLRDEKASELVKWIDMGFMNPSPGECGDWLENKLEGESISEEEDELCRDCNGSGEGYYSADSVCGKCKGRGVK